ncbi:MAG: hypothetical protein SPG61_03840 [Arcanobacterium sp.]|nr:hypothetical protein [Arcanobacterium sp.]
MFFRRNKHSLPEAVKKYRAERPLGWAELLPEGVVSAWSDQLACFFADGTTLELEWSDIANARWDGDTHKLRISFVERNLADLVLELSKNYDQVFLRAIRERIDRSVVHQIFRDLPSGGKATGQVRRNADESLFTQVISDDVRTVADREALEVLEAELREAVGL